ASDVRIREHFTDGAAPERRASRGVIGDGAALDTDCGGRETDDEAVDVEAAAGSAGGVSRNRRVPDVESVTADRADEHDSPAGIARRVAGNRAIQHQQTGGAGDV